MKKALVVLNSKVGNSQPELIQEAVVLRFDAYDKLYELYQTNDPQSITEVVRQSVRQDFDFFVAAGGDGTVSCVLDGLVQSNIPLGFLPVGTGKALARDLGIPQDLVAALDLILGEHTIKPIDALQVNDRFFCE
jgi:diacylglycerol kinase family enzyme